MLARLVASTSLLALVAVSGCTQEDAEDGANDSFGADGKTDFGFAISGQQACGILRAANDATFAELDDDAGLSARAAQNIVNGRASGPYQTLADLDAVPYVGPVAARSLVAYATAQGFVASCAATAGCVPSNWSTEPDLAFGITGIREPHLLIDPSGGEYLLYRQNQVYSPYYMRFRAAGGTWGDPELVEQTQGDVYNPSWAFAPDGTLYVAFSEHYYIYEHVVIAHRDAAGTWSATRPPELEKGRLGQLAVDGNGLHLSLDAAPLSDFAYAHMPFNGNWTVETVDADVMGYRSAMIVDAGTVYTVYSDNSQNIDSHGVLKYARRSPSGTWTKELLRRGTNGDGHLFMAVQAGTVHVAFQNGLGEVHYQQRASAGMWTDETLGKSQSLAVESVSMAVDGNGTVRVAYGTYDYGTRDGTLEYAIRDAGAATWQVTSLGTNENYQPQTSMVVDANGITHLVYTSPNYQDPVYGQRSKLRAATICDGP
jgi:hypothetical protein